MLSVDIFPWHFSMALQTDQNVQPNLSIIKGG
jgi:hypothetical protein